MSRSPLNLVVLISGNGSNLQAIIDHIEENKLAVQVVKVISNRPDAYGLQRAKNHNIPCQCLDHKEFADRDSYDEALMQVIDQAKPDALVLAGFMRILSESFVEHYPLMLNIHPSLLPKYKGLNTHQRALDNNDKYHGASVHFVTAELDGGPVILQRAVEIMDGDTADTLADRVQNQERIIYPLVIEWLSHGRLSSQNNQALLDGNPLPVNGFNE